MKFEHNNISPLDSRYAEKIVPIREAFSEKALIKTRFNIEIDWLLFLCNKMPNDFPKLSKISINKILKFKESFSDKDVLKIKKIESVTNHDVKAIEYFIVDFFKHFFAHSPMNNFFGCNCNFIPCFWISSYGRSLITNT